jgi:hypothetical protein
MFPATLFLVLPIVTTPALLVFDGPITQGVIVAAAAALITIVCVRIRHGELDFLLSVIRPIALIAVVPALWMVVQVLPLGAIGLAHPIWESASAALGRPLAGSISIDTGATLISLARYLSLATIALVASAVAVDRHRAEWILFTLTIATTLIGFLILTEHLGIITLFDDYEGGFVRVAASDCAALGIILAAATAFQVLERGYLKVQDQNDLAAPYWLAFVACLGATAICFLAVLVSATGQTYFAVACGIAAFAFAIAIRRLRFGPWGYSAVLAVVFVILFASVSLQPSMGTTDITVAFAPQNAKQLISVTRRVLAGTGWFGTGAGTFSAIVPIYRDFDELTAGLMAPTAVSAIAVEMGRPFLWATLIAAAALLIFLLRGAARRGRDPFYSIAGASCTVTTTLLAFGNAGVFSTPVLLIAAATIGVAIAQSKSRTI